MPIEKFKSVKQIFLTLQRHGVVAENIFIFFNQDHLMKSNMLF